MAADEEGTDPRRALIGLVVIVVLMVGVVFVFRSLHNASQLQDCFASGRTNCMPIESQP